MKTTKRCLVKCFCNTLLELSYEDYKISEPYKCPVGKLLSVKKASLLKKIALFIKSLQLNVSPKSAALSS